jgi:hypothetical protein
LSADRNNYRPASFKRDRSAIFLRLSQHLVGRFTASRIFGVSGMVLIFSIIRHGILLDNLFSVLRRICKKRGSKQRGALFCPHSYTI